MVKNGGHAKRITFMGTSVIPRRGQQSNSVFVETGNGDSFIFDMGSGVSANYVAMGIPYSRMDKVFLSHYNDIKEEAAALLAQRREFPREPAGSDKIGLWMGVQMNTLMDKSPPHLAEMLIQGGTMGIIKTDIECISCRNHCPDFSTIGYF